MSSGPREPRPSLPSATAERLSLYLRCLEEDLAAARGKTSSRQLAERLGITDAQVRKDLTNLGPMGRPGVGYNVRDLMLTIRAALGLNQHWRVVIIGIGNLARALIRYQGFRERGFEIVALYDNDKSKIGSEVDHFVVQSLSDLPCQQKDLLAELAIICVPSHAAQAVADLAVQTGIRGILNFAPVLLRLPNDVRFVNVDLALQMEQLAYRLLVSPPVPS